MTNDSYRAKLLMALRRNVSSLAAKHDESCLRDLLTDAFHLATNDGQDVREELRMALANFLEEQNDAGNDVGHNFYVEV